MTLVPWLRRHPLLGHFALAYGISWGGILIALNQSPSCQPLGADSPPQTQEGGCQLGTALLLGSQNYQADLSYFIAP
jgi:hypothetical protein